MAAIPKKLLALDTNILFDLAQGKDFSHTLREILQERGNALKVPPTVVQELTYFVEKGNSVEKAIALTALTEMRGWGILPWDLIPTGHAITEQFANSLIRKGFLPEGDLTMD